MLCNGSRSPLVAGRDARKPFPMWLVFPLLLLLVLVVIGSALVGGIYAAVLIPVIVIIAAGVGTGVMLRRSKGRPAREPGTAGWAPTPGAVDDETGRDVGSAAAGGAGADTPPEPATPEDILRERQSR